MSDVVGASAPETPSGIVNNQAIDLQKEVERLQKIATDAVNSAKEASAEAAKYRVEKKAATEAELAKNGQLAELNGTLQKERDELTAKNAAYEAQIAAANTQLAAIETARRNELLAKLPTDKQAGYKEIPLNVLEQITKDFASANIVNASQGQVRGNGSQPVVVNDTPTIPFAGSDSAVINKLTELLNLG